MLRRLAQDVALKAAHRVAQHYAASTSGMQLLKTTVAVQALHQSSLAYESDLNVRAKAARFLLPVIYSSDSFQCIYRFYGCNEQISTRRHVQRMLLCFSLKFV
jgi:hypothetical protein